MILSSVSSAPRLIAAELRSVSHQQRRFKAFVRRVDKNDEVYYTLAKGVPRDTEASSSPSPSLHNEFFEMPDLLLDLDAEGNRYVRPSDEGDEGRMMAKWDIVPRRVAVQARMKELEEQLAESRRKLNDITSRSTNVWRLTSHDILSMALRGGPRGVEEETGAAERRSPAAEHSRQLDPRRALDITETLRLENGIPSHAAEDDQLLLEWMMLRRKGLEHSKKSRRENPPSPAQLSKALREQISITGIRRLISQSLASGTADYASQIGFGQGSTSSGPSPNTPRNIRDACLRVLDQCPEPSPLHLETLTFIGNLAERLSRHNSTIGAVLCALALRLSAHAGLPEATSEWLHRGYANDIWANGVVESSEDVLEALKTYIVSLESPRGSGFHSVHKRQLLLQILTGIDENGSITPDSFRALAMRHLQENSRVSAQQAFAIYESYITLLGQLGATRTLRKEGQDSAPAVEKVLKERKARGNVGTLFHAAMATSLRVTTTPADEIASSLSLEECVTTDYMSIGLQSPDAWGEGRVVTA